MPPYPIGKMAKPRCCAQTDWGGTAQFSGSLWHGCGRTPSPQ
ncbi:hypothetical protein [Eikenella corrodens]|nr:hypothetical protein [Eikenella corrodens]